MRRLAGPGSHASRTANQLVADRSQTRQRTDTRTHRHTYTYTHTHTDCICTKTIAARPEHAHGRSRLRCERRRQRSFARTTHVRVALRARAEASMSTQSTGCCVHYVEPRRLVQPHSINIGWASVYCTAAKPVKTLIGSRRLCRPSDRMDRHLLYDDTASQCQPKLGSRMWSCVCPRSEQTCLSLARRRVWRGGCWPTFATSVSSLRAVGWRRLRLPCERLCRGALIWLVLGRVALAANSKHFD